MTNFKSLLLASVLGGALAFGAFKLTENPQKIIVEADKKVVPVRFGQGIPAEGFTAAAEAVLPMVVHIKAISQGKTSNVRDNQLPEGFREYFGDEFFRRRDGSPTASSGSGVIINSDGYIVTNNHVVEDATDLEVVLHDKHSYPAKVIGTDPTTDLALIKIDADNLPAIPFADSDEVRIGQWVLAVGNPFNLANTVTAGIVSAKGRDINILDADLAIESFIQTDAAVNPGNSGGALVNTSGELIGINTAIATPTGTFAGYSFAVPSDIVKKVVEDLLEYGQVQRAVLGVMIRPMDGKLAAEMGLKITEGVVIEGVNPGSGSEEAGLKKGDVIIKAGDKEVKSVGEIQEIVGRKRPGDVLEITVNRAGKNKTFTVNLKTITGSTKLAKAEKVEMFQRLGADFGDAESGGVKLEKLYSGILKNNTEIREGFVIHKVNNTKIENKTDLLRALESVIGGVMLEGKYPGDDKVYFYAFGL